MSWCWVVSNFYFPNCFLKTPLHYLFFMFFSEINLVKQTAGIWVWYTFDRRGNLEMLFQLAYSLEFIISAIFALLLRRSTPINMPCLLRCAERKKKKCGWTFVLVPYGRNWRIQFEWRFLDLHFIAKSIYYDWHLALLLAIC